jgi:hypothetical protein
VCVCGGGGERKRNLCNILYCKNIYVGMYVDICVCEYTS